MDRARGVRDCTHPYVLECGTELAAVFDGIGTLGQCRAEAVGEGAGRALEQQRPAAAEQVAQLRGTAAGRGPRPDALDGQVCQLARQRAEVTGEHPDHVERRIQRDAGPYPVGHQAEQRGAAHHHVVLASRAHKPGLGGAAERGRVGVSPDGALDLIEVLVGDLDTLAGQLAGLIVERIWEPATAAGRAGELPDLLRRGRPLLLQGAASTLADRIGAALAERAASASDGGRLLAILDEIRVGAVADSAGRIHRRGDAG